DNQVARQQGNVDAEQVPVGRRRQGAVGAGGKREVGGNVRLKGAATDEVLEVYRVGRHHLGRTVGVDDLDRASRLGHVDHIEEAGGQGRGRADAGVVDGEGRAGAAAQGQGVQFGGRVSDTGGKRAVDLAGAEEEAIGVGVAAVVDGQVSQRAGVADGHGS